MTSSSLRRLFDIIIDHHIPNLLSADAYPEYFDEDDAGNYIIKAFLDEECKNPIPEKTILLKSFDLFPYLLGVNLKVAEYQ